ncbi:MAG TPA: hypothetical protein VGE40_07085 [Bacilli bacterium]
MRTVSWISRMVFSTILITTVSMLVSWFMINLYVDKLFGQLNIKGQAQKIEFSDFVAFASNQLNSMIAGEEFVPVQPPDIGRPQPTVVPAATPQEDAVSAWTEESGTDEAGDSSKDIVMSAEDFNRKKEMLSDEDKMEVFSILISKLPQDEMQQISQFVEDGITTEEMQQAETIIGQYVDDEEYARLMEILNKY